MNTTNQNNIEKAAIVNDGSFFSVKFFIIILIKNITKRFLKNPDYMLVFWVNTLGGST